MSVHGTVKQKSREVQYSSLNDRDRSAQLSQPSSTSQKQRPDADFASTRSVQRATAALHPASRTFYRRASRLSQHAGGLGTVVRSFLRSGSGVSCPAAITQNASLADALQGSPQPSSHPPLRLSARVWVCATIPPPDSLDANNTGRRQQDTERASHLWSSIIIVPKTLAERFVHLHSFLFVFASSILSNTPSATEVRILCMCEPTNSFRSLVAGIPATCWRASF